MDLPHAGIPPLYQVLHYGGKPLTDGLCLCEYMITKGSTLQLTSRLLGGSPTPPASGSALPFVITVADENTGTVIKTITDATPRTLITDIRAQVWGEPDCTRLQWGSVELENSDRDMQVICDLEHYHIITDTVITATRRGPLGQQRPDDGLGPPPFLITVVDERGDIIKQLPDMTPRTLITDIRAEIWGDPDNTRLHWGGFELEDRDLQHYQIITADSIKATRRGPLEHQGADTEYIDTKEAFAAAENVHTDSLFSGCLPAETPISLEGNKRIFHIMSE